MDIHRTFKLTRSDAKDDGRGIGLGFSLVQQAIVLGMAGLILDGGRTLQVFSYAAVAYWICVGIIWVRRRSGLTWMDRVVIRTGFLFACAISVIVTGFIWYWRGV